MLLHRVGGSEIGVGRTLALTSSICTRPDGGDMHRDARNVERLVHQHGGEADEHPCKSNLRIVSVQDGHVMPWQGLETGDDGGSCQSSCVADTPGSFTMRMLSFVRAQLNRLPTSPGGYSILLCFLRS